LKLFPGKLRSLWIGSFVVSNVFPYNAVEITSLETNKVLKVNEHHLKTFYKGWTTELTASVKLAEPIYEEWACHMPSQWYKTKALTGRQPNTKRKKFRFAFFFPYLLFFAFYYIFVILLYSFFFYFNIEDNVVFKVWGYWENYISLTTNFYFLCCVKKNLCLIFLNSHWFMRI